jgi:tocopherol O-methyltransferase
MISCSTVAKASIRGHYNLSTLFYRLFWGPHIHHGLWDADESPRQAQIQLTERLASLAGIHGGERIVDIGCGMGGSSIHLAKTFGCEMTGVTISPFQRRWAAASSKFHGTSDRTEFRCADAEAVMFEPGTFDVVWSIECTEHLFDKPKFFQKAATWLKPGGRMAICAWLAGDEPLDPGKTQQVYDVCEGFLCPSLGSAADYSGWMTSAGLHVERIEDWTSRVMRTWQICKDRVDRSRVRWLARMIDKETVLFLDRFETILKAYQTGAMKYGCFIATRPAS